MGNFVSYMGTKRALAGEVARLASDCQSGTFLDAFSGMCSVGLAIGEARQVWSNDTQHFAQAVASAHFKSQSAPPNAEILSREEFLSRLERRLTSPKSELADEENAIEESDIERLVRAFDKGISRGHEASENNPTYGFFSDRYSGSYFGLRQSLEIDVLRGWFDEILFTRLIDADEHRWLVIALAVAASRVSTTTGHFAQPLRPKKKNIGKFAAQRKRSVFREWKLALNSLTPSGRKEWRNNNMVFRRDAESLLGSLRGCHNAPSVIYADPPYTKDQYSRFYHVYETLVLYDLPKVEGAGLYRKDRYVSQYSLASGVEDAVETLVAQCAELGSDLILSYPTNGLLSDSRFRIPAMGRKHYRREPEVLELPHMHSTMGASKGADRNAVTEVLYRMGR